MLAFLTRGWNLSCKNHLGRGGAGSRFHGYTGVLGLSQVDDDEVEYVGITSYV